jgi:hypothetical protein
MCWSAEVSLASFGLGALGSLFLFLIGTTTEKILALFLGFVSLMQLIEYGLWSNQTCNDEHRQVSILGMTLNLAQPLVFGGLILAMNPNAPTTKILALCVFYIISILPSITTYLSAKELQCTTPSSKDPHLVWNWTILPNEWFYHGVYLLTLTLLPIIGLSKRTTGIAFGLATVGSYALSRLVYTRQVFGSMWCWYVALLPPLLAINHYAKIV